MVESNFYLNISNDIVLKLSILKLGFIKSVFLNEAQKAEKYPCPKM